MARSSARPRPPGVGSCVEACGPAQRRAHSREQCRARFGRRHLAAAAYAASRAVRPARTAAPRPCRAVALASLPTALLFFSSLITLRAGELLRLCRTTTAAAQPAAATPAAAAAAVAPRLRGTRCRPRRPPHAGARPSRRRCRCRPAGARASCGPRRRGQRCRAAAPRRVAAKVAAVTVTTTLKRANLRRRNARTPLSRTTTTMMMMKSGARRLSARWWLRRCGACSACSRRTCYATR